MLHLPCPIIKVLHPFASVFRERIWDHAQVLPVGAILAAGQRTVTAAIMDHFDPDKQVGLIVDEWGTWFAVELGTNPGFLASPNLNFLKHGKLASSNWESRPDRVVISPSTPNRRPP